MLYLENLGRMRRWALAAVAAAAILVAPGAALAICGDAFVDVPGEQCDDGNAVEGDGCDTNCTFSVCGNGITAGAEACDDGNLVGGDDCSSVCKVEQCGDAIIDVGETCDPGTGPGGDFDTAANHSATCDDDCTPQQCGDGKLNGVFGEVCDPATGAGGDNATAAGPTAACDNDCTTSSCGDGNTNALNTTVPATPIGELCDDGNGTSGDGCDVNCTPSVCGNGIVTVSTGEACDDACLGGVPGICEPGTFPVGDDDDGCDSNCQLTACGNGVTAGGEECDDGNNLDADGCSAVCTIELCGDGNVDPTIGETCDTGGTDTAACDGDPTGTPASENCTGAACGDGRLNTANNEECDDGNGANDDGCSNTCKNEVCGDGIQQAIEACDDGNVVGGDGCSSGCEIEICGDGITGGTEACDPGTGNFIFPGQALGASATCDDDCTSVVCGDSYVNIPAGEQCDPIDNLDGGCGAGCQFLTCGDGITVSPEACDDGCNLGIGGVCEPIDDGDGCDSDCTLTGCGNGITTGAEACDDGNAIEGDGCDSNCTVSACGNGVTAPGEECDDGNGIAGDGCDGLCNDDICGNGRLGVVNGEQCDDGNAVFADGCLPTCVLDSDADGVLPPVDACQAGAAQLASKPRLTLNGLNNVGDHDAIIKGRFNPAFGTVCEDNTTPCLFDFPDCAGIGTGTCGLPTPHRSGVHVKVTQGQFPLSGTVFSVSVPGDADALGGEYFKNSLTPACGNSQDGWKVVAGSNGRAVSIYKNKSGDIPDPGDTVEGVCGGDAKGVSLVRIAYNPTKDEWKYIARVKNATLDAVPNVVFGQIGAMQAEVALGADSPYSAAGIQGDSGQCADAQFPTGCTFKELGSELVRVSCK